MTCFPRVRAMLGTDLQSLYNFYQKIVFCNPTDFCDTLVGRQVLICLQKRKKENLFSYVTNIMERDMFKRQFKNHGIML